MRECKGILIILFKESMIFSFLKVFFLATSLLPVCPYPIFGQPVFNQSTQTLTLPDGNSYNLRNWPPSSDFLRQPSFSNDSLDNNSPVIINIETKEVKLTRHQFTTTTINKQFEEIAQTCQSQEEAESFIVTSLGVKSLKIEDKTVELELPLYPIVVMEEKNGQKIEAYLHRNETGKIEYFCFH